MTLYSRLALLLAACLLAAIPARAQIIYSSPQTVQTTLAPAGTSCTGSPQNFTVQNLGQTQHYASAVPSGATTSLLVRITGQDQSGNSYVLSDIYAQPSSVIFPIASASGYFPKVIVQVICTPAKTGTFTLNYSGTSATSNSITGAYLLGLMDKGIFQSSPEDTSVGYVYFATPFGSSFGTLFFQYGTAGIDNSTVTVNCFESAIAGAIPSFVFLIANTTAAQSFAIPPALCPEMGVSYATGGGGTGHNFSLGIVLAQPGQQLPIGYTHVSGTTATVVKSGPGTLENLTVNTPAVGTFSVFDLAPASCTGTPATNIVVVLTATATGPYVTLPYNLLLQNGICVKASAAMDVTVGYQ